MLNFNQDQKKQFLSAAFVALKAKGFIPAFETDIYTEMTRLSYQEWGGDIKLANTLAQGGNDIGLSIRDFTQWVGVKALAREAEKLNAVKRKHTIEVDRIGVEIEIPLGSEGRLKFSAQGKIDPESEPFEYEDFYAELFNKAWHGYLAFANKRQMFEMGGVVKSFTPESGDTANTFTFTSIVMESKGGERSYKVKGKQFPLHGVRVFPEVLSEAGIDPLEIASEKYITGTATFQNKANGEPHKVVALQVKKGGIS